MYTHPGAELGVFGNIINDAAGGLNHNSGGTVYIFRSVATGSGNIRIYDGPSAPSYSGNYNSGGAYIRFYNLVTDNSNGTNTASGTLINTNSGQGPIQVEQEIRISNRHTFTNGMVWTPRDKWKHAFVHYDANGATYTGNNNSRHIDGYAAKTGSSDFDFPIGDGVYQRISGLSSPANGTYKSAYFKLNPQSGTTGISGSSAAPSPLNGGLVKISTREFWDMDGTGASQYKLTSLNSVAGYSDWTTDFLTFVTANLQITAWDGMWENLSIDTPPASLTTDGSFLSTASPTNPDLGNSYGTNNPFTAYTWAVSVFPIPLSLKLLDFTAVADHCAAKLGWTTSNEINIDRFEVEQSNNNINYHTAEIVNAKNGTSTGTYSIKINQQLTTNYYRLKIIDKTGPIIYSPVREVKINCIVDDSYLTVYPNPVRNGILNINFKTNNSGVANIWLSNAAGQRVMDKNIFVTTGSNNLSFGIKNLPGGFYLLHLQSANGNRIGQPQKIIIE
jgi:hypothetical protein